MDPILKLKGELFNMKHFYSNMHINENDDDIIKQKDVRDGLEKTFRGYDQRYGHFRNVGRSSSSNGSSLRVEPLFTMWNQGKIVTGRNDLECYTIDQVFFHLEEKANHDVFE